MFRKISLSILALGILAACAPKAPDNEVRIGEFGSMTGDIATFGITTHDGIVMAVEEANAAGGVNGKPIRLISEDDASKPEQAATVVTKLITRDQVHALLGEVASSISLAAGPKAQAKKIPMISPSSTNPKVTQIGDYIFRVCFIDPFQGKVMAKFARENLKAKTAAILRDQKNDYSIGLSDVFAMEFAAAGGQIVGDMAYTAGDVDFKAQLTALKDKKPDVIYVPGYYTEVGLISKQARQVGLKQPLLGGDGWESEKLYEIAGNTLDGSYFSNHSAPDSSEPKVRDFVAKHQAKYNKAPGALTMLGYDAANVLIAAMRRAKSLSGPDLRDAIAATKDFDGVSGKITLDADRNAVKSAVVLKLVNGHPKYYATVNP